MRTWNRTVTDCCSHYLDCSATVVLVALNDLKKTDSRLAARCAAIASLGAGAIHVAVTPMHWRDWLPSGVFFAALAAFQVLWAFIAWVRPGAVVLFAGIASNLGAAGLWVMSCVTGPPMGPSAGQPEAVNAAGIAVLLLQCYVVMGAAWAWSRKYDPQEVSGFGRAFVLMGANTIVAGAVTVGLVASLQGHHHHHHGGVAEAQGDHHDAHMGADHERMDGHMAAVESQPVTDMALHAEEGHHPPAAIPPAPAGVSQSAPPVVASSATPAPVQPQPAVVDSDHDDDGHHHHHDD